MRARVIVSTLIVVSIGSLLHFAWAWSGHNSIIAIFAAVNESTWEHLKLAFWPALLLSPLQRRLYGKLPGWLLATATRSLLPSVLIVALFYGYTSILGTNYLAVDIATFIIAIFVGELIGHRLMRMRTALYVRLASAAALMFAVAAFSTLSFAPPSWFLFDEPHNGSHGIQGVERSHFIQKALFTSQ
jgi:hypothetical protein